MHLAELERPDVLNSLMPGLGYDWIGVLATTSLVLYRMASYATEWEAVAARWAADDHALLQPSEPGWSFVLMMVHNLLKQKVAKNELELCGPLSLCLPALLRGPSSGSRRANAHVPATQARRE
jgi:hypothetical protein